MEQCEASPSEFGGCFDAILFTPAATILFVDQT